MNLNNEDVTDIPCNDADMAYITDKIEEMIEVAMQALPALHADKDCGMGKGVI